MTPYTVSSGYDLLFKHDSHAPLSVTIILDIILALSKGVPKFDCSVTRTRDNLSVVGAEADRQNIGGVADESASGLAGVQVPETQGVVPRGGKGELTIGRDDNVRDEVVVAVKNSFGVAICVLIASKLPNNDGLVYAIKSTNKSYAKMSLIPREAVRIMSGFSEEVAMAVTHPLWPGREPRKRKDSAISRKSLDIERDANEYRLRLGVT
jgi:hypothetical protein